MRLISTNGHAPQVSFREAVLHGLAPDGGLYAPVEFPALPSSTRDAWSTRSFQDVAADLAALWLRDEYPRGIIEQLTHDALDFDVPLIPVRHGLAVLELFHGPTLAFKDVGARFLARCMGYELGERGAAATILVATSGDTGSAVAQGFLGVPGVRVVVLYPKGRVSPFQEAQMATLGGNIDALRVPGSFDDCQRLVKTAFQTPALAPLHLTSANSISIGRLLPQSFYYVYAWLQAVRSGADSLAFIVPSGNLGNLTAGLLAARLGLPNVRFVAASNTNDVFPHYLSGGRFAPRASVATLSNAMDVGDPSNFARVAGLFGHDDAAIRGSIGGSVVNDDDTRDEIRQTWTNDGYLLDPHGAVACRTSRRLHLAGHGTGDLHVALATAHPAKFGATVAPLVGFEPCLPAHERDWASRTALANDLPDTSSTSFHQYLVDHST